MGRMGELAFDLDSAGYTATPKDVPRLTGQLQRVFELMKDGQWRTLPQIANLVGGSQAGVSARLRDLRKNGHTVNRSYLSSGFWSYQVVPK